MDLHTERTEAMERSELAQKRQRDEMITRKARATLGNVGWNANRETLLTGVQEYELIKPDLIDAVYIRAIQLQSDPNETGRRVPAEELMAKRTHIAPDVRKKIKAYVVERRRTDPKANRTTVLEEVQSKFRVVIQPPNWDVTYWGPAKPDASAVSQNGGGIEQHELTPPEAQNHVHDDADLDVEAVETEAALETELEHEEESLALYQIFRTPDGKTRVIVDVECDEYEGHALMGAIGGVLGRRHMKVN